ncbi:tellurite resistance TerB C-terminal domain-containing protein [Hymenobacter antarcticus]|uniref:TerB-C domain-containing protein n=1 Tax=Hymenobacter antarcticus TaxID=486270 RepID=A0ABP7QH56_9BACT
MPPKRPTAPAAADDSIIDITGLFERLAVANAAPPPPPAPKPTPYIESAPGSGIFIYNYDYHYRAPATLGHTYGDKLGLTPRQISWLDKFNLPTNNTFLNIEPMRQATLLLYLAVLPGLDRQLKAAGTTLAKTTKALEDEAKQISYEAGFWYNTQNRGGKAGTDIYLAIFRLCENALRSRFNYARKAPALFPRQLASLEPKFHLKLGRHVATLLPTLLPQVPPPSAETERTFNEHAPQRWKFYFEPLAKLLPAKVPAFVKAVEKLAQQNNRTAARETIYYEAAKLLAGADREAALRSYLHYLHDGAHWVNPKPKTLPRNLHKELFPLPEHTQRFTMIANLLELNGDRKTALEKVATVYVVERRKIELDPAAVQAARARHADTVVLLNEYLQDEPAAAPSKPNQAPTPTKTAKTSKSDPKQPKTPAAPAPAAAGAFAGSLGLSGPQQALLQLFAAHQLTLSLGQVEALAKSHGGLRNQLIDGLNDTCYELLDDVLIEESGDGYTIYEPYFRKITG